MNKIYKGTTCPVKFNFPYQKHEFAELYVTFSQNDNVVIEKNIDECDVFDKVLSVTLTPEETELFTHKLYVQTQIYYVKYSGETKVTPVTTFTVHRILHKVPPNEISA